ncbi:MAG: hypothetical protein GXX83_07885 [Gaiellales bacterium]|nr:hypothetical protein [Gaiellales bacterium]
MPTVRQPALRLGEVVFCCEAGAFSRVRVEVPGWAPARPGQFAMLHVEGSARFLARPFSLSDEEPRGAGAVLTFVVAPVGPASQELANLRPGARLSVLGPLGRGFDLEEILAPAPARGACPAALAGSPRRRLVIVAGGVGIAPFPLLLRTLAQGGGGGRSAPVCTRTPLLLCGFRDQAQAEAVSVLQEGTEELRRAGMGSGLLCATDDGSVGFHGPVTELLRREVSSGDRVVACGPPAMCRAVWGLCRGISDVQCWFSLEARMACGVGSCHGCVIPLADGSLAKVCRRGPVLRGEEAFGEVEHDLLTR